MLQPAKINIYITFHTEHEDVTAGLSSLAIMLAC